MEHKTQITKDLSHNRILVSREFDTTVSQLWQAWTNSAILEKWWAPKPYVAITKTLDFRKGGYWLYYMLAPDGNKHWCRADFLDVQEGISYEAKDAFCDEDGNKNTDIASMHWRNRFSATDKGAKVDIEITFASLADLEQIVSMGFEQGFTMALGNLDELFAAS